MASAMGIDVHLCGDDATGRRLDEAIASLT